MKIKQGEQVVYKNVLRKNKSGGGIYIREIESVGKGLLRPLSLKELKPEGWYYIRPNGVGYNYYPVQISHMADYQDLKSFIRRGMLFVKAE